MGKSRDDLDGEFPDVEIQSEASDSSQDFKVAGNETFALDDGNSDRRIGRYRLIRPIGEGGMGVVWHAVQEHPVKRDVALKLVRKDLGKDALVRFEAERQAIAMMDHPNIAKILDADTTDDGSPYFVMELVKGVPLDQYCNSRKLNVEQRLRLMLPVCRAVQHAHQKAILHRDLKHSNILVSENDDKAAPKVIDFGLAKALGGQQSLTDKTVFTEFGKVVGTISYMSPEQADSGGMDIDTRSDIYSLGVVLYKLLAGRTPIQMESEGLSVIGAMKLIRDKDPIAPSVAVRKNEGCSNWAKESTKHTAERLSVQLKGDLDSIALKALEKDRRKRYETANGLALDIERYLNQEPVLAQPRSTTYAIKKFVQRNKGLVASLATIGALLIGGIVATSLSLMFAISATDRAELNAELYKLESVKAKDAEKLRSVQLKAQLNKSAWSNLNRNNVETAWQSLRQMREIDPDNPGWVGRYLANEMYTTKTEDMLQGGHAHYVLTVDASSKGDYILSGGTDDTVCLWNARNNKEIYRRFFDDIVKCVRFSNDQKLFAVADRANVVSVFETSTGDQVHKFGPFEHDATSLDFHPHKPILAIGFYGNDSSRGRSSREILLDKNQPASLMLTNVKTGEILRTIEGHPDEITSVAFDASGERLVTGCVDGNWRLWISNTESADISNVDYKLERTIFAHPGGINAVDVSSDGLRVASCGVDKVASIWDVETGKLVANLAGHNAKVLAVSISPDGKLVATGSNDDTAIVWNLRGEQIAIWRGHTGPINEVCFTVDGQEVITASDDQSLRRWSVEPAGTTAIHDFGDTFEIWHADFSPDKETIATANESGLVHLVGSRNGKIKKELKHEVAVTDQSNQTTLESRAVLSLVWLNDGRLITAGNGFGLWVWDRLDRSEASFQPSKKIELPESLIWDVNASPTQDRIITAGSDGKARVFDSTTFKEIAVLEGHDKGLASAAFSPDGKLIATGSDDTSIRIWDANTYELQYTLDQHLHPVWRSIFSPTDPNLMASCADDGTIHLWDLESQKILPVTFAGHKEAVAGLTFTDDGKSLVSASDDGTVRVWDIETGVELFVFHSQLAEVMIHASFSKDGQSLVTCGVGVVNVRHASEEFVSPYLQHDSIGDTNKYKMLVYQKGTSQEKLREILSVSKKVVKNYPTWDAFENLGIAQYRLGMYQEAVSSFKEARRFEKIVLNSPETNEPFALGYLALAYSKLGKLELAHETKTAFNRIAEEYWGGDEEIDRLVSEVNAAIN